MKKLLRRKRKEENKDKYIEGLSKFLGMGVAHEKMKIEMDNANLAEKNKRKVFNMLDKMNATNTTINATPETFDKS